MFKFPAPGFADSIVDVPDEQAAIANSAIVAAAHQVLPNAMRMA